MKMRTLMSVSVLSIVPAGAVWALPSVGAPIPSATVEDADGRSLALAGLAGRPILIFYEDRASATQNQALKDDLARLARGDRYRRAVVLVPVADVGSYDFWPAKGLVTGAIRDESRKVGTTIYCDWNGSFGRALSVTKKTSNVVLAGRNGKILFARAGALSDPERARVLELLRAEIGPSPSP